MRSAWGGNENDLSCATMASLALCKGLVGYPSMRLPRTLAKYVLREVLQYSLLGLLLITTVLVSRNALRHLDALLSADASGEDVLTVIACLAIALATYAIPVAFLFGVLLAIRRIATDVEIVAMHSCGIGTRSLVLPVAALGVVIAGITAFLTNDIEHRAQRRLRLLVQTLAAEGRLIEPGDFRRVGERVLHVKRRRSDGVLEGVLIADRSDPERPLLIFAETGELMWNEQNDALHLLLRRGDIHIEPPHGAQRETVRAAASDRPIDRYRRIEFASFDYRIEAEKLLGVSLSALRPREMTAAELRSAITRAEAGDPLTDLRRRDPVYYRLHLQRRLALPVAPVLFALVGVPLAIRRDRGGRSWSVFTCALVAFVYYALLTFGQGLALDGVLSAAAALWLPNGAFAVFALGVLWNSNRVGFAT